LIVTLEEEAVEAVVFVLAADGIRHLSSVAEFAVT